MNTVSARVVLVVEDDPSVRRPLVKFLEMHGFTVITADTAEDGVDALRTRGPHAAVVDLRLRRGSGRDVVAAASPDMPILIFSGLPSESAELERLRPRTRLIEKPVLAGTSRRNAGSHVFRQPAAGAAGRLSARSPRPFHHRIFLPSTESTSSAPSSAVVFRRSSVGFTSTTSTDVSRRESATSSMTMCASR